MGRGSLPPEPPVRGRTMGGSIVNGGLVPSDEVCDVLLPPADGNLFQSGDGRFVRSFGRGGSLRAGGVGSTGIGLGVDVVPSCPWPGRSIGIGVGVVLPDPLSAGVAFGAGWLP